MAASGYLLAYERIRLDIELGRYLPGSALPSENELARSFNISRTTLRKALARLNVEKFLISRPGLGNFVRMLTEQRNSIRELNFGIEVRSTPLYSPFLVRTLDECMRAGQLHRANLIMKSTHDLQQSQDLDGAIFTYIPDGDFSKVAALSRRMPVIMINRMSDLPELSYVAVDYADTVFRIVGRLLKNGARRIAFFGSSNDPLHYAPYTREIGFRRAFAAAGVELDEGLFLSMQDSLDIELVSRFLLRTNPKVAFIVSEGLLPPVLAALEAVKSRLLTRVYPICFDDIAGYDPYGRFMLSGVSMPFGRMSERAVEYLVNAVVTGCRDPIRETFSPYIMVNDCPFLI